MKRCCVGLVLALGVAAAFAATASAGVFAQSFFPIKDATIPGHSSENNCNIGALSASRTAKDYQYTGAYDFDTAAVSAWLSANTPVNPTSLASIQQAISDGRLKVEFSVCQVGTGYNGYTAQIRTIDCAVDWTEGNGTSKYPNLTWGAGTVAATWTNPNQKLAADGGPLQLGWGLGQNVGFTNAAYTLNSQIMTWGAVSDSYATAPLDAQIAYDLLNTVTNRGLYNFSSWTMGGGTNNSSYMREQGGTGTTYDPKLTITYTEPEPIPEPAALTLLLLGLPLALRRRKA